MSLILIGNNLMFLKRHTPYSRFRWFFSFLFLFISLNSYSQSPCSIALNDAIDKAMVPEARQDLNHFLDLPQFFYSGESDNQALALHNNSVVLDYHFLAPKHFEQLQLFLIQNRFYPSSVAPIDFRMSGVEYDDLIQYHGGYSNLKSWIPRGISLLQERTDPIYFEIYKKLYKFQVGEMKNESFKDRVMIADLFFSSVDNNAIPSFATGDKGIYQRLAEMAGVSLNTNRLSAFTVTILDRSIRIIPINFEQYQKFSGK